MLFICYRKKKPTNQGQPLRVKTKRGWRITSEEKMQRALRVSSAQLNRLVRNFRKTAEGKHYIETIDLAKKSRAELLKAKNPDTVLVKMFDAIILRNQIWFYEKLIKYVKQKDTFKSLITLLRADLKKLRQEIKKMG